MTIDESSINHNAILAIKDILACMYECIDTEDKGESQKWLIQMLAEIRGVIDLADNLKEVLKL